MLVLRPEKSLLVSTVSQTKQRQIVQTGTMKCHSDEREYFHSQAHYLHAQSSPNLVTTHCTVIVFSEKALKLLFTVLAQGSSKDSATSMGLTQVLANQACD